jgi:hypothetical protein
MKKIVFGLFLICMSLFAGYSIESQESTGGGGMKYFLKCNPGGMTIITGIPSQNTYWDNKGIMHSSFSAAANASCN